MLPRNFNPISNLSAFPYSDFLDSWKQILLIQGRRQVSSNTTGHLLFLNGISISVKLTGPFVALLWPEKYLLGPFSGGRPWYCTDHIAGEVAQLLGLQNENAVSQSIT